jgi:diacylglycerol kinase (ATP)
MIDAGKPRRYVIVLNPAAGRGRGASQRARIEQAIERAIARLPAPRAVTWEIVETARAGDGTRLAAEAAASGADLVAAAGGDGTLGEVVNGIAGTGAALAILPLGTGNDFARGIGLHRDLGLALDTLFHGIRRRVDLGRCGDRWFINVAGCGFDAIVAERVNRGFRHLRGTSAYIAAVVQSMAKLRAAPMRITLDGEAMELRGLLCAVANAPLYGGGMRIAPDARVDDGLLDVCIVKEASALEFAAAFPRVFAGTHVGHPKVAMFRGRNVRVESDPPLPLLVDGEVIGATPAEFTVAPLAITLMTPCGADESPGGGNGA